MSGWISVGNVAQEGLPKDCLSAEELQELQRLLGARQAMLEQMSVVEQQVELLILAARDRRGLSGRIRVRPEDGRIEQEEPKDV